MQISLVKEGLLARGQLSTWSSRTFERIRDSLRGGMKRGGARMEAEAKAHVQSKLKGRQAANSIRARVWDRNRSRLPGLQLSSKIRWLGVHERGRTITGRMLIPFGTESRRMKRETWRKFIDKVLQEDRAFFRTIRGTRILFVRPASSGTDRRLGRFRSGYRAHLRSTGRQARIKRDRPIPVAISVNRVTIKKRLNIEQIVKRGLPLVVRGMG